MEHAPVSASWLCHGGLAVAPVARAFWPISGGRRRGFRTCLRRRMREPLAGDYGVDVMTDAGQLPGRVGFTVTP
jgi:hypothetical protein